MIPVSDTIGAVVIGTGLGVILAILLALNVSARWQLTHWQQIVHEEVQAERARLK